MGAAAHALASPAVCLQTDGMKAKTDPFDIRMMYAVSRELIDYAARLGMNWVVVATYGHKDSYRQGEDLPRGFGTFLQSLLRYGPMYSDWQDRISTSNANLSKVFRAKEENRLRAEQMCDAIDELKGELPQRARKELSTCFGYTRNQARSFEAAHKLFFTLWSMRSEKTTTADLERVVQLMGPTVRYLEMNPPR